MLSAIWPRLPPLTTYIFGGNTMNDYLSLMEQARQAEDLRDWKTAAQLYTLAMAVSPKTRTMRQRRERLNLQQRIDFCERNART